MAEFYLKLVEKVSLTEMATTWEIDSRLDRLFEAKGLNNLDFENVGITFGRPRKIEFGIYQLIDRVYRRVYCKCAFSFECSYRFPGSLLSWESIMNYGFD